jgi:hypothetical protein
MKSKNNIFTIGHDHHINQLHFSVYYIAMTASFIYSVVYKKQHQLHFILQLIVSSINGSDDNGLRLKLVKQISLTLHSQNVLVICFSSSSLPWDANTHGIHF